MAGQCMQVPAGVPSSNGSACAVEHICVAGSVAPCVQLASLHDRKLRLCSELESIADTLPQHPNLLICLLVASELVPLLAASHQFEEDRLFPAFMTGTSDPEARGLSVRRLRAEHVEDACAAQDITELLFATGHGHPIENPEAFGFMLRGFFENVRRHVAFEREHIMPIVAEMQKTASDIA